METFVWDQNFITGIAEVDQQHHSLVDLFNELHAQLFRGQATDVADLEAVFKRLLDYAAHHFAEEEEMMRRAGVDRRHASEHERAHLEFVSQVRSMWRWRQTLRQPGETIMGFLTAWLGLHILGVDRAMARQIRLIEQGRSGAQAFEQEAVDGHEDTRALLRMVGNLHHVLSEQNNALMRANQELEARVESRTRQLAAANQELSAANAQLHAYSRTDGLLQIANRACVDERIKLEVARALREGRRLGLLMLDVDFFKRYNDTYGHQAGDACLQAIARAGRQALARETDFIGRYGGEELLVLLPDTDAAGTEQVGQRLLEAVRALALPHAASDAAAVVTLSIGACSAVPTDSDGGAALIAQADAALYEAKHAGRNRVVSAAAAG